MRASVFASTTDWVNRAGILIAGVNLFNLEVSLFNFNIASTISMLLTGYKAVFHTAFDVIFFWVPMVFKWSIPDMYKDIFVIWTLCVGTTYKAEQSYLKEIKKFTNYKEIKKFPNYGKSNSWFRYLRLIFAWWSYLPTGFSGELIKAEQDEKNEFFIGIQSEEHFFELTEQGLTGFNPYAQMTLTFGLKKDKLWFVKYFVLQLAATLLFVMFIAATNHGLNMVGT